MFVYDFFFELWLFCVVFVFESIVGFLFEVFVFSFVECFGVLY